MSYLVLARKWRPQTFDQVIGQPHVTRTLQNAIKTKRIAHAYLFTGARGVGKTSVARILAKALNCQKGTSPEPCNQCSNCLEIAQGNAVDVLEIDGASNRGIDSIRELRETVRYRPAKSPYKIYIIDEVHMLTTEAFNALLKTLEEPPAHVVFIFATTEPHKIPTTILSRCQRYDFRRIPTQDILEHLSAIASAEGVEFSSSLLFAVAREADGSMRDAQSLMEQLLAFRGEDLPEQDLLDLLGVVDRESIHEAARAVVGRDVKRCLEVVDRLYRRGIDTRRFCRRLCEYFRDLLVISLSSPGENPESYLDVPEDEFPRLKELSRNTTPETLFGYFQLLVSGEEEVRRSGLPRVALEMLLLRMATLPQLESLDVIIQRLEGLAESGPVSEVRESLPSLSPPKAEFAVEEHRGTVPRAPEEKAVQRPEAAEEKPSPEVEESPVDLDPDRVVSQWEAFCRWVMSRDEVMGAKLKQSRADVSEGGLTIQVLEVYEESFKNGETEKILRAHMEDYFQGKIGFPVKFTVKKAVVRKPASRSAQPKNGATRTVLTHPVVRQALEILGGELVEIRPLKPEKQENNSGGTGHA